MEPFPRARVFLGERLIGETRSGCKADRVAKETRAPPNTHAMSARVFAALRQKVTMSPNPFTLNPFVPSFTLENPFSGIEQEKTPTGETSYVMVQSARPSARCLAHLS